MDKTPNARFWIHWNGDWVKITLTPGEDMSLGSFESTDEGFTNTWVELGYDSPAFNRHPACVTRYVYERSRDCDGLTEHSSRDFCLLDVLRAEMPYTDPDGKVYGPEPEAGPVPCLPRWTKEYASSRDHTAEAAGY